MQSDKFNDIIDETLETARETLTRKSEGYSTEEDRLHNFRTGSALNGITMEQVCWGMATKHIISIRDMVMSCETYASDIWDEKIGDAINYLALLKAITVETSEPVADSLRDLREKLTGSLPRYAPAPDVKVDSDGSAHIHYVDHPYSHGTEPVSQQAKDLESIKRVADKLK